MFRNSPRTLGDVVDWGLCVGCGACASFCSEQAIRMVHVEDEGYRPVFNSQSCAECSDCLSICPGAGVDCNLDIADTPHSTDQEIGPTLEIWEGWAAEPAIRTGASSGGILTALSLYCIERESFDGVIHAGMDSEAPWLNRNYVSQTREAVLARMGSRYAPSMPCAAIGQVSAGERHVFVGKPCDVAALHEVRRRRPLVNDAIGLVMTFFCAGTPSTAGTLELLKAHNTDPESVDALHYRGDGWPGEFRVKQGGSTLPLMSYEESWRLLTSYRPLRCNLCPDGTGRMADLACGDAWHRQTQSGDQGISLVLVRTELGRRMLARARAAGYVVLRSAQVGDVIRAQPSLLKRRRELFGRLLAFRLAGARVPRLRGFSLFSGWFALGPRAWAITVGGTLRRIVRRRWYRRRVPRAA